MNDSDALEASELTALRDQITSSEFRSRTLRRCVCAFTLLGAVIALSARRATHESATNLAIIAVDVPLPDDYRTKRSYSSDVPGRYVFGSGGSLYYYDGFHPELGVYPLNCNLMDDDGVYPLKPYGHTDNPAEDCEVQDSEPARCEECLSNEACATLCWDAMPRCQGSDSSGAFEYIQPCRWQAIADTPAMCNGTFKSTPPLQSRNLPPKVPEAAIRPDNHHDWINLNWSCSMHSMCQACADPSEPSGVNIYCFAAILTYDQKASGATTKSLFDDIDFWCSDENLERIHARAFD